MCPGNSSLLQPLLLPEMFPLPGTARSCSKVSWECIWLAVSLVQSLSHVQLFVTGRNTACQASLSITNSWSSPNSCPLSQWCHPTISSSVVPFSSCPHLSQHQGLFQWFESLHQVAKVASVSASVLPMNIQGWFPVGLSGLVSLLRLFTRLNNFRLVMLTL